MKAIDVGVRLALKGEQRNSSASLYRNEAIKRGLREAGGTMTSNEIGDVVKRHKLHLRKDGDFAPASQISAQMNNYRQLFQRLVDGRIKLKG